MGQSGTKKRSRKKRLSTVNPSAAGIDVGSQFHVVAVPGDRDEEPVRTLQSFTGELHLVNSLPDRDRGHGIDRGLLDPAL